MTNTQKRVKLKYQKEGKMREIRIEARMRNNILYHAIFDNWKNTHRFSLIHKLNASEVGKLLNLTKSPVTKKGKWRPFCLKLADILGQPVEVLFPLELYSIGKPMQTWEFSFAELPPSALQQIKQLSAGDNPEETLIKSEKRKELLKTIQELDPREEKVILMYFGLEDNGEEHTLEQIAEEFGVSPERIRQIKARAMRKLRLIKSIKPTLEALTT